ncbi:MAG: VOC family protein [Lautropia sp.]
MQSVHFAPRRLGHVNLWVGDLERSIRFFEDICGLELVRRERDLRIAFHSNGNTHHDVGIVETSRGHDRYGRNGLLQIPKDRGTDPGLNHLGWEMEHEQALVAAYRHAQDADGVRVLRAVDHIVAHSVYVADPDGNAHEFYADELQDWRSIFNLEQEDELTAAWTPQAQTARASAMYPIDPVIRRVDPAPLHASHLAQVTLATRRLEPMLAFFERVAGLTVRDRTSRPARSVVLAGTCRQTDLVLEEAAEGQPTGLRSVTFALAEPVQATDAEAVRARTGAKLEARRDSDGAEVLALRSPDGLELRFREPTGPLTSWL